MGNPINHGTDNDRNIIVQVAYDKAGRMTGLRDPNGNLTSYEYDLLNRRTKLTNPLTNEWSTGYTDLGGGGTKTILTDPNGVDTERSFDRAGRLSSITYGNPANTPDVQFAYDLFGNRTQMTEYGGAGFTTPVRDTTFGYDDARRLTSVGFDNDGNSTVDETVSYAYDAGGLRTQLTLPGSKVISYIYDERGQLISLTDWDDQTSTFGYDKARRHVVTERDNGLRSRYTHDAAGRLRLLRHTQDDRTAAHFAYEVDGRGNRTQAFEAVAHVATGNDITLAYNANSIIADGTWTFDAGNGFRQSSDPTASLRMVLFNDSATLTMGVGSNHGYFDIYLNRALWRTFNGYAASNGTRDIVLELEGDGPHLLEIRNRSSEAGTQIRFKQLVVEDRAYTLRTIQYIYDSLARVQQATYYPGINVDASVYLWDGYSYDRAGNRTHDIPGAIGIDGFPSTVYTYNEANQLTQSQRFGLAVEDPVLYEYDDNGNLTEATQDSVTLNTYNWTRANRLVDDGTLTHQYDGLGNRISQNDGTDTTHYLLDLQPSLANVLRATIDTDSAYYIHGLRGIHAQQTMQSQTWNYPLQDGLGSVRAVDSNGIQSVMSYTPYGQGGTPSLANEGSIFGFTGEQTDSSELIYLRARYYNPALGTFMSLDPFEGVMGRPMSLNGYSWVEGNVVNALDPSGHQAGNCDQNCGGGWFEPPYINTVEGPMPSGSGQPVAFQVNGQPARVALANPVGPVSSLGSSYSDRIARIIINPTTPPGIDVVKLPTFAPAVDVAYNSNLINLSTFEYYFNGYVTAIYDGTGQHIIWFALSGQPFPGTVSEQQGDAQTGDADRATQILEQYSTCGVATKVENDVRYACGHNSIFRSMIEAPDGLPTMGTTARYLGARPDTDIPVQSGMVSPSTGGMSVTPGSPFNIVATNRRPPEFGGIGKDPIWCNDVFILIPFGLQYRPDPEKPLRHGFVEPASQTTFDLYQNALWSTRPTWRKVNP